MRRSRPQPIGDVLQKVVRQLEQAKGGDAQKLFALWPKIAGKKIAQHARPISLRKGLLRVLVDDSAWFYQINLQKQALIDKLQQRLGKAAIQNIQFRIGKKK